jgi:polyhydroxyalkanoate synthase
MLTDAFSPSNFLISNPAALREVMQTKGESLVRGMQNFAADLERGGGQLAISQTDSGQVQGRRERRHRPGQVVYRDELFELLQFDADDRDRCTRSRC